MFARRIIRYENTLLSKMLLKLNPSLDMRAGTKGPDGRYTKVLEATLVLTADGRRTDPYLFNITSEVEEDRLPPEFQDDGNRFGAVARMALRRDKSLSESAKGRSARLPPNRFVVERDGGWDLETGRWLDPLLDEYFPRDFGETHGWTRGKVSKAKAIDDEIFRSDPDLLLAVAPSPDLLDNRSCKAMSRWLSPSMTTPIDRELPSNFVQAMTASSEVPATGQNGAESTHSRIPDVTITPAPLRQNTRSRRARAGVGHALDVAKAPAPLGQHPDSQSRRARVDL
jgi:hypothetical protein